MRILVQGRDVNGAALTLQSVHAKYDRAEPDGATAHIAHRFLLGAPNSVDPSVRTLVLVISHDDFQPEIITLEGTTGRWLSDCPAATLAVQGDLITVDVTLGCINFAPTVTLPPDSPVQANPQAALVDPDRVWRYRDVLPQAEEFSTLSTPLEVIDQKAAGWGRFRHVRATVEPEKRGSYVLLEYGHKPDVPRRGADPRFLLAVWVPSVALGPTPQVLAFFSPPTKATDYAEDVYPFRRDYPYAAFKAPQASATRAADVHPPYTTLPGRYLISRGQGPHPAYKIVYQLLAAGRNPIVIMPINAAKNWGPMATQRGLCRLIKEVVRFLYARQLVCSRTAPVARFTLAGGRPSVFPARGLLSEESVPSQWVLTVAGFSNGIDKVLDLCDNLSFKTDPYAPALFDASPEPLVRGWREVWDIDGVAADGKGAERHLKSLRTWMQTSGRNVRSYHSGYGFRTEPRGIVPESRIKQTPSTKGNGVTVQQGTSADGRATFVHFSDASLDLGIDDPHHTVVAVAFALAARYPLP